MKFRNVDKKPSYNILDLTTTSHIRLYFTFREKKLDEWLTNQRRKKKLTFRSHICHLQYTYPCYLSLNVATWLAFLLLIMKPKKIGRNKRINIDIHRKCDLLRQIPITISRLPYLTLANKSSKFRISGINQCTNLVLMKICVTAATKNTKWEIKIRIAMNPFAKI